VHTGPGFFTVRPSAHARAERAAVLLSVVVVTLLGVVAPAFARGDDGRGNDHGRDDRRPDLVGEMRRNVDRAIPDEMGDGDGSGPAEEAEEAEAARGTAAPATAPAVIEVAEVPSAPAPPAAAPPAAAPPAARPPGPPPSGRSPRCSC
jgi:hypothetical protein